MDVCAVGCVKTNQIITPRPCSLKTFAVFKHLGIFGIMAAMNITNMAILDILAAITIEIILIIVSITMNVVSVVDAATDRT